MRAIWILTSVAATAAIAGLLVTSPGCNRPIDPWGGTTKPRVLTSIVPLHCFAASIAEPDAEVRCLLTERGPHGAQPSPHEAKMLSSADLFVVNGLRLENFVDALVRSVGNPKLQVLRAGEQIPRAQLIQTAGFQHGDHFHAGGSDPHVWLGLDEAKIQVEAIRDALIQIDPAHAEGYRQRTRDYLGKLDELRERGAELKDLQGGVVTFHDSFRYFCRSFFGPKYEDRLIGSVLNVHAEQLSPQELQEQVTRFRAKQVRAIAVEPQFPKQGAETIAKEVGGGVQIIELDPLENVATVEGRSYYVDKDWYIQRMQMNIDNLKQALQQ
jgi:ABC-type Zn uptake system ZnuABC Zn-binding protein ZnuA